MSDPRFVFLIGTGRCGSSLLHELLARHPGTGFVSNVDDVLAGRAARLGLDRRNGALHRRLPAAATRKGRVRFAPSEAYRLLARRVGPVVVEPDRDLGAGDATPWLRARFRGVFLDAARRQGAPVFLHKFTGWPRAGFIDACLDDVRFVHVVRDGRAVANSWLQMPWWRGHLGPAGWHFGPLPPREAELWEASGRSYVVLAGLAWRLLIDAADDARRSIADPRWLDVRYEDLLNDPEHVLDEVVGFCGLAPSPDALDAARRLGVRRPRRDAWRTELLPVQVRSLDEAIGSRLERWGYGPDGSAWKR
ncbi:MAG: sulfotransferase [Acidimicrobiales bacterium]|nr:sulfotransferase [Acidimicrobiales bacterium]